jgi:hypothetical protein
MQNLFHNLQRLAAPAFTSKSRHGLAVMGGPPMAKSGLLRAAKNVVVRSPRSRGQHRWNFEKSVFGLLQVN